MDREHDRYVVGKILELIRSEYTLTTWTAFERQVIQGQKAQFVADSLGRSVNAVLLCKSRVLRRIRELARGLIDN